MHDFVSRFMPAYRRYIPMLYAYGPQRNITQQPGFTAPWADTAAAQTFVPYFPPILGDYSSSGTTISTGRIQSSLPKVLKVSST